RGTSSCGKCCVWSHSLTCGRISVSANSRTLRRSSSCSSVSRKSISENTIPRGSVVGSRESVVGSRESATDVGADERVLLAPSLLHIRQLLSVGGPRRQQRVLRARNDLLVLLPVE